jgi:hypothetical protein
MDIFIEAPLKTSTPEAPKPESQKKEESK